MIGREFLMKFDGSFGQWLKQRRKGLDLTQQELADQISYSVTAIRKIERDIGRPSKHMAERLADVLAVSLEDRPAFVNFARKTSHTPFSQVTQLASLTPT